MSSPTTHPAQHAIDLSFMALGEPSGIEYWTADRSGNWTADYEKGRALAVEYLAYIGQHHTVGNSTLLGPIVEDMIAKRAPQPERPYRCLSGVEHGFLRTINEYAMAAAAMLAEQPVAA